MAISEAIETRLELRDYADDPVDAETKRRILNAARLAPSGKNVQHWAFILVDEPEAIDRLASLSTSGWWVSEADFAVVILTDPAYEYHEIDAGRAVTHMQFEAWNQGVGSCIYTGFDDERMREFLEYPADLVATLVAGFGYPPRPVDTFAGDKDRAPLDELVHHGTYGTGLDIDRES